MKKLSWQDLNDKTNELSLRERAILASVFVVVVLFIWLQFVFTPYEKQAKAITSQKNALMQDKVTQSQRLSELSVILSNDPNKKLREEQAELNGELEAVKSEIESRLSHLIAPEKMADVMQSVLSDYKGLTLLSARNLKVEPLKLPGTAQKDAETSSAVTMITSSFTQKAPEPETDSAAIFAHGFEMTLQGSYFQTVEFLQRLETMSGFYWQALDYQVDEYPKAQIKVQISTLSLEEDWIGV